MGKASDALLVGHRERSRQSSRAPEAQGKEASEGDGQSESPTYYSLLPLVCHSGREKGERIDDLYIVNET